MKIPADILEASKEYDKQREEKQEWLYQKDFNSYQELATVLKKDEFNTRDKLADNWNKNHPKSKTSKQASDIKLNFNAIGDVLSRHLHYCKLGDSETDRVAFYDVMKGIYTLDYSFIQWCIFQVSNTLTEKNSYNVIYYLKQKASVKPLTKDKNLIVVGNGIFNLESKKLEPFSPDYVFTNKIDTNYNEKALQSPKIYGWEFDQWLLDLTKDENGKSDKEIYKLLWQVISDSLNGNYTRQKSFFLYSPHGSSGKGTFQSVIANLVGKNNVATLKMNEFKDRFAMSRILGKSVVIGDDNPDTYISDSSNYNSVVTGDNVNVEYKGKDSFTAYFFVTVIQSFNAIPRTSNKGGTERRMMIVPFRQHFQGNNDNWKIKQDYLKRKSVLEYILYTALNKYSNFDKFVMPKACKILLNNYEVENDPIKAFIDDEFNNWNVDKISTDVLYRAYNRYADENGFIKQNKSKFVRNIQELLTNYKKVKSRISHKDYLDIKNLVDNNTTRLLNDLNIQDDNKPIQCLIKRY